MLIYLMKRPSLVGSGIRDKRVEQKLLSKRIEILKRRPSPLHFWKCVQNASPFLSFFGQPFNGNHHSTVLESNVTRLGDFCTLGNHSKPVTRIILPNLPILLGNLCKGVKIIQFSIEINFGQLLWKFGDFYLVTLLESDSCFWKPVFDIHPNGFMAVFLPLKQ